MNIFKKVKIRKRLARLRMTKKSQISNLPAYAKVSAGQAKCKNADQKSKMTVASGFFAELILSDSRSVYTELAEVLQDDSKAVICNFM